VKSERFLLIVLYAIQKFIKERLRSVSTKIVDDVAFSFHDETSPKLGTTGIERKIGVCRQRIGVYIPYARRGCYKGTNTRTRKL
jgi:hypothetical protein